MSWMQKLIELHNKKANCLLCDSEVDKDKCAVIEYRHAEGSDKAFVCDACAVQLDTSNLRFDDDQSI
jgi:hypothetical protein